MVRKPFIESLDVEGFSGVVMIREINPFGGPEYCSRPEKQMVGLESVL